MTLKPYHNFLRSLMKRGLDWLERVESSPPRAQKPFLHQIEIRFPPVVVAIVSAVILYGTLFLFLSPSLKEGIALALVVVIFFTLLSFYLAHDYPKISKNEDAVALLSVNFFLTLIGIFFITKFSDKFDWLTPYLTPLGIGPLLTALLIHPRLAMVMAVTVSMIAGIANQLSFPVTFMGTLGTLTIVFFGAQSRTAYQVVKAGLLAGLVQALAVLFITMNLKFTGEQTLIAVISAGSSGIIAGILSLGVLPILEGFFSQISNIRLLELADVNHPLLKQMSIEAPGSYHHSLIVAALAEDAANAIGANGLLCRVGSYFHDVGKIVKPEYFIENQATYGNPHDKVTPSLSSLVISSHVKEGIALTQAHRLDQRITDFIAEHHGTSQIEYFLKKALEREENEEEVGKEEISEESYRYQGPKPQSKETAIVMLADATEAASRSLEDPNHQRIQDLVFKIINKKFLDGQLDDTALTLKDLQTIAERFAATLLTVYHVRIPYPEEPTKKPKKEIISPPNK